MAAALLTPLNVPAQQAYSPGQTFTSSPTPAPYSQMNMQRQLEQSYSVQQPVQRQPAQQNAQRVQQPDGAPMYNMNSGSLPAKPNAPAAIQNRNRSAGTGNSASASTTPQASSSPSKEAKRETVKSERGPGDAPQAKASDAEPEATEQSSASDAPVVAEPTDKLVFFSRTTGRKQVALTYDDGPNPAFTPRLADWLKDNNVPATFFVCGNMVKEYPDTVKQLAEDGFELANHTYSHPDLRKLSSEKIIEQVQDTHDVVKEATGIDMNLMRPPYGAHNSKVDDVCKKLGYKIINWDVDTEDWRKRPASLMVKTIMSKTGDGSIILMHDRKHGGKDTVLETTQQAVEQLRARGYTFVTVGELLDMPPQSSLTTYVNKVELPSASDPEISALPGPPVNNAVDITTSSIDQTLPAPAIMTPAPIVH